MNFISIVKKINFLFNLFLFLLDDEYHLCELKSSLINDGPPLNDFDQNLLVNGLTNGIQLTIRCGSVAPRNHVRLKVFRIINKYCKPHEASMNQRSFNSKTKSLVL
jgi:hypothetical protein